MNHFTAADAFTKADPVWNDAMRKGARSGSPIEIYPPRKEARGLLIAVFGSLCGWAGFFAFVGFLLSLRGS